MPLLKKGVLLPAKGVDYSLPSKYIDPRSGFPQNMRFYRGEMRKRPGKTALGSIISDASQIMGYGKLELNSGIKYLVRASKQALEKYNTTTEAWESIAALPFTGGDDDFFSFADITESGILVVCNGVDRVRKWTGSGNNEQMGGNPGRARYATYLSPYLLLAGIDDGISYNPWKVLWPTPDDPEDFTGLNSGEALLSDEPSPIMNIAKMNEYVAAYKGNSLYLGMKVDPPDNFRFSCVQTGVGLAASRAFVDVEGQHYFMGLNDFYTWQNGMQPQPIGGPVRDEVFSRLSRMNQGRCFALHIQELTEIWFFIVTSGYSWPREIWKYNYRLGFWYFDTCADLTAASRWEKIKTEEWDDETGVWDDALDNWDDGISTEAWEEVIFGHSSGLSSRLDYNTANDLGLAVDSQFVTQDYFGEIGKVCRWEKLDLWLKGPAKLYVDYSVDEGSTWMNIPYSSSQAYIQLTSAYKQWPLWFDVRGEQIRFRLRSAESGTIWGFRDLMPYYLVKEGAHK